MIVCEWRCNLPRNFPDLWRLARENPFGAGIIVVLVAGLAFLVIEDRAKDAPSPPPPTPTQVLLSRADIERAVAALPEHYRSPDGAVFAREDEFREEDESWRFLRHYAIPSVLDLDEEIRLLARQFITDMAVADWDDGPAVDPTPLLDGPGEFRVGQWWERENAKALILIYSYPLGTFEFPDLLGNPTIEIIISITAND